MRTSNIERRTSNVEPKKIKRERKRLQSVPFASSVRRSAFDVECSMFAFCSSDVRCSYQSFCESVFAHFVSVTCSWILHPPLQASCIRSADDFMKTSNASQANDRAQRSISFKWQRRGESLARSGISPSSAICESHNWLGYQTKSAAIG